MKKMLSLIIVMLIALSCVALAEDSVNLVEESKSSSLFNSEDLAGSIPSFSFTRPSMKAENFAPETTDQVTINGSTVVVKTADNIILMMNVPMNYTCITQDFEASLFSLMRFTDPEALIRQMIEYGIHLILINDLNGDWYYMTVIDDSIASLIGNLNTMNDSRLTEYGTQLSIAIDCNFDGIRSIGSYKWIQLSDNNATFFLTVVNGKMIKTNWEDDEGAPFNEDALADVTEVLSNLMIFG